MSYSERVTTLSGHELGMADIAGTCEPRPRSPERSGMSPQLDAGELAAVFKALGSPVRLRLLGVIQARPGSEACVCELVDVAGVAQSTVSHHLAVLVASGLVRREQRGTWAWYALVPERLEAARALLASPDVQAD
jgi:ArsR family transcriptional regulator